MKCEDYIDRQLQIILDKYHHEIEFANLSKLYEVIEAELNESYNDEDAFLTYDAFTNYMYKRFGYAQLIERFMDFIPIGAFSECETLVELVIPEGIKEIKNDAFYKCPNLKSVRLPDSLTSIGQSAFLGCINLSNINFPDALQTIGSEAFCRCAFNSVSIPMNVLDVGENAFKFCSNLREFKILGDKTKINGNVIALCNEIEELYINPNNSYYVLDKYCLIETKSDCNDLIIGCKNSVISDYVDNIQDNAFSGCEYLSKINIPSSVKTIGKNAFGDCAHIKEISIPSSVTEIGDFAFLGCNNLEKVVFSNALTKIGYNAFFTPIRCIWKDDFGLEFCKKCNSDCHILVFKCPKDSLAEQYAIQNQIKYVNI